MKLWSKAFAALLFLAPFGTLAQELLAPLSTNPVLEAHADKYKGLVARSAASVDTLDLPFYDDFSDPLVVPRHDRWMDTLTYINMDMAIAPPSYGVATFDGLNGKGRAYNIANQNAYGVADYLTSAPIDLNYLPSDSVYLSFYYQMTGLGNAPEAEDSLVLEFRSPTDTPDWVHIWSTPGDLPDTVFRSVYISITDTTWLTRGFQFRFKNYATLSGNLDHWHVDYIILDEGRSRNDSAIDDICISERPESILEDFYAVPWTHFNALNDPYKDNNVVKFWNRASGIRNVNFGYRMYQDGVNVFNSNVLFKNSDPFAFDSVNYIYQTNLEDNIVLNSSDSSNVTIKYFIQSVPDVRPENDTLTFSQKFYNYYAYDDGTAERGYALNDLSAKMVYYIDPLIDDTLRGLLLYFPPTLIDATENEFRIGIWTIDGQTGAPAQALYKSDSVYVPRYTHVNNYARYILDVPQFIDQPVYIGIEQVYNNEMYVGFDRNNDNSDKLYYFVSGLWLPSELPGTLMMRPMFGKSVNSDLGLSTQALTEFTVFPNPAASHIRWNSEAEMPYRIVDLQGRTVASGRGTTAQIQNLAPGTYILFTEGDRPKYARFIKVK
ncbi:MAG: hypothetical protein J4F31_10880 [Flavobacteriales bacterium]|nr:hypothetical protein [Flavobacteriales bacterium]